MQHHRIKHLVSDSGPPYLPPDPELSTTIFHHAVIQTPLRDLESIAEMTRLWRKHYSVSLWWLINSYVVRYLAFSEVVNLARNKLLTFQQQNNMFPTAKMHDVFQIARHDQGE